MSSKFNPEKQPPVKDDQWPLTTHPKLKRNKPIYNEEPLYNIHSCPICSVFAENQILKVSLRTSCCCQKDKVLSYRGHINALKIPPL